MRCQCLSVAVFKGLPGSSQLPFGPSNRWYAASYTIPTVVGAVVRERFPVAFRPAAVRFLAVLFPPRAYAFLAVGLPAGCVVPAGPWRGFHVPHLWDAAGIGCLLYPGIVVLAW